MNRKHKLCKRSIINYIDKLKDDLVPIDVNHVHGEWYWSGEPALYTMINTILSKFTHHFYTNLPLKRDFDSFVGVLLSNVYSLSKEDENSKNILDTALLTMYKIEPPKNEVSTTPRLVRKKRGESQNSLKHKILLLNRLVNDIKKESARSNGVIEELLRVADEMPIYLQVGFVTSLLMYGEIYNTLNFSLMFKKKLGVWVAISDYCHKIFEHINEPNRSFYVYEMSSNDVPPVIVTISDSLSDSKEMLRTFEELSAIAYCLSVCGDEEKTKKEKKKEKKRLLYVPYKLYNCSQNNLAIEFLENSGDIVKSDEDKLELECLSYFAAGRYQEVIDTYETYRKKNKKAPDNNRVKSTYMLSQAFRYKFEYKFYKELEDKTDDYIRDCIKKLDIDTQRMCEHNKKNVKEVLRDALKELWEDTDNSITKPPFNPNDLFVFHCFKYNENIRKYAKPNWEKVSADKNYMCCLGYYRAFAQLEDFHADRKKNLSEFETFINDIKKFGAYCDKSDDLSGAYDDITSVFSENENLFLRSTHFLSLAPKVGSDEFSDHIECWLKCLYFVFLSFKIQDRLAIHSDTLESQTIGTYMKLERYRQNIVETKKHMLPLFNAAIMNDPTEGEILTFDKPTEKKKEELKDSRVYTLSLSALGDNLPMWDRYADNGKGVCAVISKEMLYRPNLDIMPRDENEYYSRKILRLEDSRKMYRLAYIKKVDKDEEEFKVTHIGGLKEEKGKEITNADGETIIYKLLAEDYYKDFNQLLKMYVTLGNNLTESKSKKCCHPENNKACNSKIIELVQYYHNKIRYLFKSHVFESEDEIRLISFDHPTKESVKLPDRYLHYVYWTCPLKIDHVMIGPRAEKFRSLVPYLEDSVLETKRSIFTSKIETKNVTRSKIHVL